MLEGSTTRRGFHSLLQEVGTLALLLRLTQWSGVRVDTSLLEKAAADFQAKINEAVSADPKLSAYVRELKKREFEQ